MHVKKGSSRNKHFGGVKFEIQRRTIAWETWKINPSQSPLFQVSSY